MRWESSGVVRFDLGPLLEGQMRTAKLKSAYNSLIIGPRGFGALSLRWIQFASVLRCARSSLLWNIDPYYKQMGEYSVLVNQLDNLQSKLNKLVVTTCCPALPTPIITQG